MSTKTKIVVLSVLTLFAMGTTGEAGNGKSSGGVYIGWLFITLVLFLLLVVQIIKAVKGKKNVKEKK